MERKTVSALDQESRGEVLVLVKDELTEIQKSLSALQQRLDLLVTEGTVPESPAEETAMESPKSPPAGGNSIAEEVSRSSPTEADSDHDVTAVLQEMGAGDTSDDQSSPPEPEASNPSDSTQDSLPGPDENETVSEPSTEPREQTADNTVGEANSMSVSSFERSLMATLRAGMSELATAKEVKEIPRFFTRLTNRTGLRLVVLKRWRTGMQVYHTEGIKIPEEARKKRPDGRAPIPVQDDDIFAATADEHVVYAGPVPVKRFPLDLTLMLGRGSKNRQIVILPVPVRDHWNTFLYLDADYGTERALAVAEILAQYALARMSLLNRGEFIQGSKTAAILKQELRRRQESQARRAQGPSLPEEVAASPPAEKDQKDTPPPEPVMTGGFETTPLQPQPVNGDQSEASSDKTKGTFGGVALADMEPVMPVEEGQATPAASTEQDNDRGWTPETILQHSGELPALPRAASHILAVIENPRTTATKLEKAIALDQALTAKVLRIANSPFYGAVRDIKTVSEAVVRLGFVTIRNWTLVAATKSVFLTPGAGLLFQKIWRQSVLSAMASQLVAQKLRDQEPESVFLGGLMQNIGQLVLARAETEMFHEVVDQSATRQVPYHVIERELLGFDHGELGALLIREWNLSRDLEEAVRFHHRLDEVEPGNRLPAMIALGEEIADCSGSRPEEDEVHWESSEAARFLDVSAEVYAELRDQARLLSIDPQFFS